MFLQKNQLPGVSSISAIQTAILTSDLIGQSA